ncbi:TPA: HEPN domain-containing protein [Streptococcus suis]
MTKKFLKRLLLSHFDNTMFDQETLNELAGELNSTLNNSLERKNHRRIVLALSSIVNNLADGDSTKSALLNIDSNRIQQLVKIRNDIAHGNKVNVSLVDLGDVEYLSRQLITLTFFRVNFEQVYIRSKKFDADLWSYGN